MPRQSPRPSLGQTLQLAQLILTVSNINWKKFTPMWNFIKAIPSKLTGFGASVNLGAYWGRLLLVGAGAILIGFVLFDWRSQAVQKVEARAALAVAVAERDTLRLKIAGDTAAATERQRILMILAENNRLDMEELNVVLQNNQDWANQPLPNDLRERLR